MNTDQKYDAPASSATAPQPIEPAVNSDQTVAANIPDDWRIAFLQKVMEDQFSMDNLFALLDQISESYQRPDPAEAVSNLLSGYCQHSKDDLNEKKHELRDTASCVSFLIELRATFEVFDINTNYIEEAEGEKVTNHNSNQVPADSPDQTFPTAESQPEVEAIPFEPGFVNLLVHLKIHGRDDWNGGGSELSVLMAALTAYKEKVSDCPECEDNDLTLELIDELQVSFLDVMYTRLSESSEILHRQKYPPPARRKNQTNTVILPK